MNLITEAYTTQNMRWPTTGRHILAQYDDDSVIVYQAYRPSIGLYAAKHGHFGGEFSLSRMSWIKPGFLWMMYRSGWGSKAGQEIVLAIRLQRLAFDMILEEAVHSAYVEAIYGNAQTWKEAIAHSSVRLQWDPDHNPTDAPLERRAIQLGLRGTVLKCYAHEWILEIQDISSFVKQQHYAVNNHDYKDLVTPRETIYPVNNVHTRRRLGLG